MIVELNERSREIFRRVVEAFVETGEPVGSRTISRRLGVQLSPATIRNVMADLEEAGLLYAPHTSAGRLPTEAGLRLFVDGLLEVGSLTDAERQSIDGQCAAVGRSLTEVLEQVSATISGLTHCAGLVYSPKIEKALKHIEFVPLGPGRALVVIVSEGGLVENRVLELAPGITPSMLIEAGNFLNARVAGLTLDEARSQVMTEIQQQRAQLDELTRRVVEAGIATWSGSDGGHLIVRGRAHLLDDVNAIGDLERIRSLFDTLETRQSLLRLIDATSLAEGVQIFIGAENELFQVAGCAMIVAPFSNGHERVVGAIGVVGPMRMNYARIIPMVDYTAKLIGRLLG
ncbi:MAG: heat-inducible transcriptional repressor HrcA [Alphaproteobacteria bacterium]|nr:heat-inducible transcriptional repressor HrcA [Alphaproteobacteria bacterium]